MSENDLVQVYRVTAANGQGMYRTRKYRNSLWVEAGGDSFGSKQRPMPEEDGINVRRDKHFFAFENKHQLNSWLGGFKEEMGKCGGQVRVFEVPRKHVVFGNSQVAFTKRKAKLVEKIPLTHF